jgi:hypothetical protein
LQPETRVATLAPPMRVRSLLLAVCMVVVPLLAMFSHRVPPDLVRAVRALGSKAWAAAAGTGRGQTESNAVAGHPAEPIPQPPTDPPPKAAEPAQSPAVAARLIEEEALVRLGATSIGCQRVPGGTGMLATCRVAVDPAGELQRVFQAAGEDRPAALRLLLTEVETWRRRTAWRPPVGRGS